jgi:Sigma-70 region 2
MANGRSEAVLERPQAVVDAGTVAGVSDGQLLSRFNAHGDELAEIAFTALVRRHGPMVLRVCRQVLGDWHTAEDAFQATFLILARRAGSIRRPELLGHWFLAWPCGRRGRRGCGASAGGDASPPGEM